MPPNEASAVFPRSFRPDMEPFLKLPFYKRVGSLEVGTVVCDGNENVVGC